MSYSHQSLNKATHTGDSYIPLTVEKEILAIRKEIEDMGKLQTGSELELIFEAYKQIKSALGQQAYKSLNGACSGCTIQMKKLLINWFKKYDDKPFNSVDLSKLENKPLVPLKPIQSGEVPPYNELLKRFNEEASDHVKETINDGKRPNKSQLYEYFKI